MATTTSFNHAQVMEQLLQAAATSDRNAMADLVTADVIGWSPTLAVRSRQQLLEALDQRDDALSGVVLTIQAIDQVGDKAIAEWVLAADHTGNLAIDEDVVVEPTGRRLHLSGATIAEFDGDRVCAFRTYFDDLAIVEQVLS